MSIEVEAPRKVTVIAPMGLNADEVLEKVKAKSQWIVQKLFEIREIEHRKGIKQYVNGESFLYMGRNYSLHIEIEANRKLAEAKLSRGKLIVFTPSNDEEMIRKALIAWYRAKAREKIIERVNYYLPNFDVEPSLIIIKEQQKRWGSCTSKKKLLFNWKCIMAPANVLDYIVVHEMCHLVHMDHSKEYWQLLQRVMPDYELRKTWLKHNGIKYDL
jgi:predicted metal-dependent hydrolase